MGARTRITVLVTVALLAAFVVAPALERVEGEETSEEARAEASAHVPAGDPRATSEERGVRGEGEMAGAVGTDSWESLPESDPLPSESEVREPHDPLPNQASERRARDGLDVEHGPGTFVTVQGSGPTVGSGPVRTYSIEVEGHLTTHAEWFASDVERMLSDPRGWTATGSVALRRVDDGWAGIRVTLASPATVDALCAPLETNRRFSCWNDGRAVINAWRWEHGAAAYGDDIEGYRTYLVNHEVGHGLGHGHVGCPAPGTHAPVMMQQTVGVDGCTPNPWPYPDAAD